MTRPDHGPGPEPRRAFLRRVGATIAAGVGLVAFGGSRAGAGTTACTVYCRSVGCPTDGCPPDHHRYSCIDDCTGSTFDHCISGPCQARCLSTVCP